MIRITKLEITRHITKWTVFGLVAVLILGAGILQMGIGNYQIGIKKQQQFLEIEQKMVDRLLNWMQYGAIGFRVLMKQCPLIALFYNNTAFDDLMGFIDTGVRLRLVEPKIGPNAFKNPTGGRMDYSWYLMHFGVLLVMVWGFFTFRNKEYIRYLMNFSSPKSVFLGMLVARMIISAAVLAIMVGAAYVQFLVNGISLSGPELSNLLLFLAVTIIVMALLLSVSAVLGAVDNIIKGAVITALFWIVVVSLWPELLNVMFTRQAAGSLNSTHQLEIRKMGKLMDFERDALKQSSRYKSVPKKKESDRLMAEYYWTDIFKDIESIDNKTIHKTEQLVDRFHFRSIFNPISFLKSVNNEISSVGFNGFIALHKRIRDIRRGFLRKYYDKRFYENYSRVEPYLPKGKNIIKAKSSLPRYFLLGVAIQLFYLLLVLFPGYIRFRRYMFPPPEKGIAFDHLTINIIKGIINRLDIGCSNLRSQVLNVLYGNKKKSHLELLVDNQEIAEAPGNGSVYVPNVAKIPGTTRLVSLAATAGVMGAPGLIRGKKVFGQLGEEEKVKLLLRLAIIQNKHIFILDDFLKRTTSKAEIIQLVEELKADGVSIIDFVSDTGSLLQPGKIILILRRNGGYRLENQFLFSD
ncbi:MAG: hypothetical protein GY940_47405 [bacterium]|nr:hypothetical protein [bacterium]